MKVYSETIFSFIDKCELMLKDILKKESDLRVRRKRFEFNGYLYPIDVIVFEGKSLGYFDSNHYQIGINKALVFQAKDKVLKDILRHELAHYLTFLNHGADVQAHGSEFQQICKKHSWPSEVSKASMDLGSANLVEGDIASEKILNKVKNLLKLAESSNPHEAELATIKANQLLLKHNLNYTGQSQDEYLYVKKILSQKRKDAKISALYDIIRHFMVKPVLTYGKNEVSLEVTGSKTNLELAEYVVGFLNEELERLWLGFKKEHSLKGIKAKNSFFYGVAKGYDAKIQNAQASFSTEESRALTIISNALDVQVQRIYNRLSSTSSSSRRDNNSFNLGKKAGSSLNINKGVKSNSSPLYLE